MNKIPDKFNGRGTQKGWQFEKVEKCGKYAIYKKTSESNVVYEVIHITVRKAREAVIGGVSVSFAEAEQYPGDRDFGVYAWTYPTEEKARVKYERLCSGSNIIQKATLPHAFG